MEMEQMECFAKSGQSFVHCCSSLEEHYCCLLHMLLSWITATRSQQYAHCPPRRDIISRINLRHSRPRSPGGRPVSWRDLTPKPLDSRVVLHLSFQSLRRDAAVDKAPRPRKQAAQHSHLLHRQREDAGNSSSDLCPDHTERPRRRRRRRCCPAAWHQICLRSSH